MPKSSSRLNGCAQQADEPLGDRRQLLRDVTGVAVAAARGDRRPEIGPQVQAGVDLRSTRPARRRAARNGTGRASRLQPLELREQVVAADRERAAIDPAQSRAACAASSPSRDGSAGPTRSSAMTARRCRSQAVPAAPDRRTRPPARSASSSHSAQARASAPPATICSLRPVGQPRCRAR